jgi:hypothetical protein
VIVREIRRDLQPAIRPIHHSISVSSLWNWTAAQMSNSLFAASRIFLSKQLASSIFLERTGWKLGIGCLV